MKNLLLSFIYFTLLAVSAFSFPVKITNFDEMVERAPIIVGAKVRAVQQSSRSAGIYKFPVDGISVLQVELDIQAVFKGDIQMPIMTVFYLHAPSAPDVFLSLEEDISYILFLDKAKTDYLLYDPQNGAFMVEDGSIKAAGETPIDNIREVFEASLISQNEDIVTHALQALAFCGNRESLSKVEKFNRSTNDAIRIAANTASVKLGDWRRIKDIVEFWEARTYPDGAVMGISDHNLYAISLDAVQQVSEKDAVSLVIDMLNTSENPYIKQKLIGAFTSIGDPGTAEALLPILYESDNWVSYQAYVAIMKLKGLTYFTPERFEKSKQAIFSTLSEKMETVTEP